MSKFKTIFILFILKSVVVTIEPVIGMRGATPKNIYKLNFTRNFANLKTSILEVMTLFATTTIKPSFYQADCNHYKYNNQCCNVR